MTTEPAPVRAAEKSPTQSGSGSGNGRFFAISAFALFTLLACSNLPTPLYRLYAQAFHFSPLTLTLVFAVYVGTMVPSLLVFGPLSDAIGRRPVLVGATAAAVAAMLVFMLATSTPWLLLARGLQGVAVGAASGALTAALSEFEPRQNRDRAALATTVASLGGLAAGPLIAGSLAQYGPARLVLPYVAGLALLAPVLVFMLRFPDSGTRQPWQPRRPAIPRAMLRPFALNSVASFVAFSVLGLFLALAPSMTAELTHTGNLLLAGGAVTLLLLSSMAAQWAGFGRPTAPLQRNGLVTLALGLALVLVAADRASLPLLLLASLCVGAGHGLTFLGGISEINLQAPAAQHAEVVSTYYVVVYLGLSLPVVFVGFLAARTGLLHAVQVFGYAVILVCCCIAFVLHASAQRR